MFSWLQFFELERFSFILGFISATFIWFIVAKGKKYFPKIKEEIKKIFRVIRQNQISGVLNAVQKEMLRSAQSNHIAGDLFSLDEIIIEPMFTVKPPMINDPERVFESETGYLIPFTPDSPFLARNFNVPRISISEAIQGKANLVLSGISGSGKTVALSHLVSCLILEKNHCAAHKGKVPFFVHIHDTGILDVPEIALPDALFKSLSTRLPAPVVPRLARFIKTALQEEMAILLIDGLDELTQTEFDRAVQYIENILDEYQGIQIITTSSPYYFGNLLCLGFKPIFLTAWSNRDLNSFYSKWRKLWASQIDLENSNSDEIIYNWITRNTQPLTPLEYTLLTWGAYSGTLNGSSTLSIYESYFVQVYKNDYDQSKLVDLAFEFIEEQNSYLKLSELKGRYSQNLIDNAVFRIAQDGRISFQHTDFLGFLASQKLPSENDETKFFSEEWSGGLSYKGFSIARGHLDQHANHWIDDQSPPTYLRLSLLGNFLRHIPQKSTFRNQLIRTYVKHIQNPKLPFSTKLRFITGFAMANDPSTTAFIRQLLSHPDIQIRKIGLAAVAITRKNSVFINDLLPFLEDTNIELQKFAAISLSIFDEDEALHGLGRALLSGDENLRQLVAESLAQNRIHGAEILRDAIDMEDILVRRSAIFGLIHINELWVIEALEKLSYEDSQWVVRNIAVQALEFLQKNSSLTPKNDLPFFDHPWLISFAGKYNIGVSPDQHPSEILVQALKQGTHEDAITALDLLPRYPSEEAVGSIYEIYYTNKYGLQEQALLSLIEMEITGIHRPTPLQFGFVD